MSYQPPFWLFWLLVGVAILIAIGLTIRDLRVMRKKQIVAWDVYDNIISNFENLKYVHDLEGRDIIFTSIRQQQGRLSDKRLDKLVKLYLNAESEIHQLGLNPVDDQSQTLINEIREDISYHISNKYGEREYDLTNTVKNSL